jgi:hypothetical protein
MPIYLVTACHGIITGTCLLPDLGLLGITFTNGGSYYKTHDVVSTFNSLWVWLIKSFANWSDIIPMTDPIELAVCESKFSSKIKSNISIILCKMHFLFNELQYAINITCILNDIHRKSFMQCKSSKWYCFNTSMAMLYYLYIYGQCIYKLQIQQESYKARKRIVSCKSTACKNVLKRVIFQLRIYHTRYIPIY